MLNNYVEYLKILNNKLDGFFANQAPYIFCKKGCSKCCEKGEYPFSKIEIKFLLAGALLLDDDVRAKIGDNIKEIIKQKKEFKGDVFLYKCPFLIDNECVVYDYRGIICRTFGLISSCENSKIKAPFCSHHNLNYSNVMDLEKEVISEEKYSKLGDIQEPLAFNIDYKFLTGKNFEEEFGFEFGEKKSLIDWLERIWLYRF